MEPYSSDSQTELKGTRWLLALKYNQLLLRRHMYHSKEKHLSTLKAENVFVQLSQYFQDYT